MRKPVRKIFLTLGLLSLSLGSVAQNGWQYTCEFNVGVNLNLYFRILKESFPGVKAFAGASVRAQKENLLFNYAASIAFYRKMIGNNMNPLVDDNQVDFSNMFTLGLLSMEKSGYEKHLRTFGNCQFYNLSTNNKYGFYTSTCFVFNNHRRNQSIGSFAGTIDGTSFFYANDGGPLVSWLSLADMFDRWWTGNGGIFIHQKTGYNEWEVCFDQFTGYEPQLYELSGLLGFNVPEYNGEDKTNKKPWKRSSFNTSSYDLKYFFDPNFALHFGCVGSLKHNRTYYGIQDMIHIGKGYPLHPNNDFNRFYFGGTYLNQGAL